jgi:photosystem II stability/assembly factor-like uncharacterized protein
MTDKIDIEAALRGSLAEHARQAPAAGMLAERIIGEVNLLPLARERRRAGQWRAWTLPLIAAGSVAAVAAALVGVTQFRHSAVHKPSAVPLKSVAPAPTPTAAAPKPTAPTPRPATHVAPHEVSLTHFQVIDLTFVGADLGWALGTADCLDGSGGRCAAMVRTSDGGANWHSMKPPPANVAVLACNDPCIHGIRFATDQIGYAYGPSAFFMTADGGANWLRQPGGAQALETLDGNVIRVLSAVAGCSPPGCHYDVETAPVDSDSWHRVALAGDQGMSVGVALARTGNRAFLLVLGHVSGGAQNATSILYTSADDGATWTRRGEPCPQTAGQEVDSTHLASAQDGSVTVVCTPRGGRGWQFTSTSVDGGVSFRPGATHAFGSYPIGAVGAASRSILIVSEDDAYRSPDGGRTWRKLSANAGSSPGPSNWIGFESATLGRAVSPDGRTISTTRDAGLTWISQTFQ